MQTESITKRVAPGVAQQIATRVGFFIAGFAVGAWAPLVPYVKARAELNEAQLGFLLLCLGGGSMLTMPFANILAARFGCRRVVTIASIILGLCLPFLSWFSGAPALAASLLVFGGFLCLLDVTINIQASIVEKHSARPLMSGFHGFFSVGGLVGATLLSGLLLLGLTPLQAIVLPVIIIALLIGIFARNWLPYGMESNGSHFVWPRGKVLLLGILCFITFLVEGAILDWAAVFLTTLRDVPKSQAGFGYVAFAIAMTIGRLLGDRWVAILGGQKTLIFGGACAAFGLALAVLIPSAPVALLGFTLVGIGASNVVPVFFTQASRQKFATPGAAIGAITTMGYVGSLAGPAAIGFVAQASNLALALGLCALCLMSVPLTAKIVMARE